VFEKLEIERNYPDCPDCIVIAPDLVSEPQPKNIADQDKNTTRISGSPLKVVFISRISPIKNLHFLLEILSLTSDPVLLTIYGPIEDNDYWLLCQSMIGQLPDQISVEYKGPIQNERVCEAFSEHDLFVFPTKSENFGHVIYESLVAGTPVVMSDRTLWMSDQEGAIKTISLDRRSEWVEEISNWARFTNSQYEQKSSAAFKYAHDYNRRSVSRKLNIEMFEEALKRSA
jgi:glycosyltransferase involved in cell wall biosynthesis